MKEHLSFSSCLDIFTKPSALLYFNIVGLLHQKKKSNFLYTSTLPVSSHIHMHTHTRMHMHTDTHTHMHTHTHVLTFLYYLAGSLCIVHSAQQGHYFSTISRILEAGYLCSICEQLGLLCSNHRPHSTEPSCSFTGLALSSTHLWLALSASLLKSLIHKLEQAFRFLLVFCHCWCITESSLYVM